MLLFRSEEHANAWCTLWGQPRGELVSLEQVWGLARGWYGGDPRDPGWRRKTLDEAQAYFTSLGLTSPFWSLQ
jgi:Alkylmercury lyase